MVSSRIPGRPSSRPPLPKGYSKNTGTKPPPHRRAGRGTRWNAANPMGVTADGAIPDQRSTRREEDEGPDHVGRRLYRLPPCRDPARTQGCRRCAGRSLNGSFRQHPAPARSAGISVCARIDPRALRRGSGDGRLRPRLPSGRRGRRAADLRRARANDRDHRAGDAHRPGAGGSSPREAASRIDVADGGFNIGSDDGVSIGDLAARVKALTGSSSAIVHVPYEDVYGADFEAARYLVADISKLEATIGYRPTLTLDAILQEVIAYFRECARGEIR